VALKIDREKLDEFCPQLFRTLDGLGRLPPQLWAKPTEFEKYSRLLFGSIQRYNDVEAGFKEWESRVLRDAPYRKEEHYPEIETLRRWMAQHAEIFTSKVNMQHLRTSLYARVFTYLYPRRVLMNTYCKKHHGNSNAVAPEFVETAFPDSISAEVQKLREVYSDEWQEIVSDTKARLIANAPYYRKVLHGDEPVAPSDDEKQEPQTEEPEEAL
jgi:hypothetical protein